MSGTRYYQILNGLIDAPEALAFDPMLVKRLRRMRATRQRARSARRLGVELGITLIELSRLVLSAEPRITNL